MPKSQDFLLALLLGFSERIHPGIFRLKFWDIPGFIFFSNGYISYLVNLKFSSLNGNIIICFRKFLSEHFFQNTFFRTPVSEQLFQNICYRKNVSSLISKHFWTNCCCFSKYLIKYEKIMSQWQNMETSLVCKAKFPH